MALDPSNSSNLEQLALKGLKYSKRTISELWQRIGQIITFDRGCLRFKCLIHSESWKLWILKFSYGSSMPPRQETDWTCYTDVLRLLRSYQSKPLSFGDDVLTRLEPDLIMQNR